MGRDPGGGGAQGHLGGAGVAAAGERQPGRRLEGARSAAHAAFAHHRDGRRRCRPRASSEDGVRDVQDLLPGPRPDRAACCGRRRDAGRGDDHPPVSGQLQHCRGMRRRDARAAGHQRAGDLVPGIEHLWRHQHRPGLRRSRSVAVEERRKARARAIHALGRARVRQLRRGRGDRRTCRHRFEGKDHRVRLRRQ